MSENNTDKNIGDLIAQAFALTSPDQVHPFVGYWVCNPISEYRFVMFHRDFEEALAEKMRFSQGGIMPAASGRMIALVDDGACLSILARLKPGECNIFTLLLGPEIMEPLCDNPNLRLLWEHMSRCRQTIKLSSFHDAIRDVVETMSQQFPLLRVGVSHAMVVDPGDASICLSSGGSA